MCSHRAQYPERPYCVYVHVPYCRELCSFCALYRFGLPANAESTLDLYTGVLIEQTEAHDRIATPSSPSTVHFGGGTPLSLGIPRLADVTAAIAHAFHTDNTTEWAIETTSSSIEDSTMRALVGLGFSRIHVGVQSLDDRVREAIGRRESGDSVRQKLEMLLAAGLDVSVDLIVGLPGQDLDSVKLDLDLLFASGIRTFSVCELVEMKTAKQIAAEPLEQREHNFVLWRELYRNLVARGLEPIHYGQFARSIEDNLYYTFPARKEDCYSLGAYAHGWFGNCFCGNKLLPEFSSESTRDKGCWLAFGYDYGEVLGRVRDFESQLLSNNVRSESVHALEERYGRRFSELWGIWLDQGLVETTAGKPAFRVTAAGNWFLGNMTNDLRGAV